MKAAAEVIEDLEFLDDSLVGAFEAAERTGFASAEAMEQWLKRHDCNDLWLSMKKRDPEGAHWLKKKARMDSNAPKTHPLTALLDEAEASTVAKHRRKAERVRSLLAELKTELDADRERREAEAAARTEVERLQAELAAAKEKMRRAKGGPATTTPKAPSSNLSGVARAWALANNVACPRVGRVPRSVIEAYEASQSAGAALTTQPPSTRT